eukprot:scaffold2151_cov178-Alexandrium_tamarense.AAC.3
MLFDFLLCRSKHRRVGLWLHILILTKTTRSNDDAHAQIIRYKYDAAVTTSSHNKANEEECDPLEYLQGIVNEISVGEEFPNVGV